MALIKNITVTRSFKDGALNDVFKRLDYPAEWKVGERRDLPEDVLKRAIASGAQITIADPGAKESKIVEGAAPAETDALEAYTKQYGKDKRVLVVFPEGFKDGTFTEALAAIGHPAEIGVGEILELPLNLIEKIKASGGMYDTDPEIIQQTINNQGKHQLRVRQWQEEQERNGKDLENRKAKAKHNKDILAEIESLSSDYINATGSKTKEAIWQRIGELRATIK